MTSSTGYNRGDVFVVSIPFPDGTGFKRRPSVIISGPAYHRSRREVMVFPFTGNTRRLAMGSYAVSDWQGVGLDRPSATIGIIVTVNRSLIGQRAGRVSDADLPVIDGMIKRILRLAD